MGITFQYLIILALALLALIVTLVSEAYFFKYENEKPKIRHVHAGILVILVGLIVYLCMLNFPVSLTLLVIGTGIIALIDQLFFARKRKAANRQPTITIDNARSFFPVLLFVWVIRSFIVQPYHVPTGSLEPTVVPGDFIVVNQYHYGLRFPIGNFRIINVGEPKIGDIALFYYPPDTTKIFIKRVIGTPGDHVVYKNKILYINGKEAVQTDVGPAQDVEPGTQPVLVEHKTENLNGVTHDIYIRPSGGETADFDIVVPAGMYFMMGDNRDNSDDSRTWGYVPEQNLVGTAWRVIFNWDTNNDHFRWSRSGTAIH